MKGVYDIVIAGGGPNRLSLARQAASYNLMHPFIEDLNLEPGDWWYPSPWLIPSDT